jgi:hypothetical protein
MIRNEKCEVLDKQNFEPKYRRVYNSYLFIFQAIIVFRFKTRKYRNICICLQFKRFTKQNHNLQVNQIRDPYYDWKYGFVTLEEYIAIAKNHSAGIYPEFKELTATNQVLN